MSISEPGLHKKLWRGLFPKKNSAERAPLCMFVVWMNPVLEVAI